jgi:hypothetical protein
MRILDIVLHDSRQRGAPDILNSIPKINNDIIDISQLFMVTMGKGGYDQCNTSKLWTEVASSMGYSNPGDVAVIEALRETYTKVFLSFERRMNASKKRSRDGSSVPGSSSIAAPQQQPGVPGVTASAPPVAPQPLLAGAGSTASVVLIQGQQIPAQPRPVSALPMSGMAAPAPGMPGGPVTSITSTAASGASYLSNMGSSKKSRPSIGGRSTDVLSSVAATSQERPREALLSALVRKRPDKELIPEVVQQLASKYIPEIVKAVNVLMVRTTDADSDAFLLESYPTLIMLLGDLLDQLNPLPSLYFTANHFDIEESLLQLESRTANWNFQSDIGDLQVKWCLLERCPFMT